MFFSFPREWKINTQYVHLSEMLSFIAIAFPFPGIREMSGADNVTCELM